MPSLTTQIHSISNRLPFSDLHGTTAGTETAAHFDAAVCSLLRTTGRAAAGADVALALPQFQASGAALPPRILNVPLDKLASDQELMLRRVVRVGWERKTCDAGCALS